LVFGRGVPCEILSFGQEVMEWSWLPQWVQKIFMIRIPDPLGGVGALLVLALVVILFWFFGWW
jgi:hypothetical protein